MRLFRPLLRHVWEYSQYYLFGVCGSTPGSPISLLQEFSHKSCIVLLGVLKKHGAVPPLREHSHKSGIVLPGVLPNKLKLYTGSDLDMISNLDELFLLDTLETLSVLLFLVSGSTPNRLIIYQWE